ncbi:MAG: hypothetical protein K2Q18_13740 [Bdellovibrionales bacterium]|nr:hypothetical protein [Bdellovibrionales bacterium]
MFKIKRLKIILIATLLGILALNLVPCYIISNFNIIQFTFLNPNIFCSSNFTKTSLIYPVFLDYREKIPDLKIVVIDEHQENNLNVGKSISHIYSTNPMAAVGYWHALLNGPEDLWSRHIISKSVCASSPFFQNNSGIKAYRFYPDSSEEKFSEILCSN